MCKWRESVYTLLAWESEKCLEEKKEKKNVCSDITEFPVPVFVVVRLL